MRVISFAKILSVVLLAIFPVSLHGLEADFTQSVPYVPGMSIKLDCRVAKVRLAGTDGQSVEVVSKGHPLPEVAYGDSVLIITVPESGLRRRGPEVSVSLPRSASVAVDLGVGDLEAEGLGGLFEAKVGVGNIVLSRASAHCTARTGTGDIKAWWGTGDVMPEACRLSTGVGEIEVGLPQDTAVRITAETGLGSIRGLGPGASGTNRSKSAGTGGGSLALSTGIGDIRVKWGAEGDAEMTGERWKEKRRVRAQAHFGGGGGFFVSWPDRSYRDFNAATSVHGYPAVKKESYAWGGEGYAQFNRFRIGGMGWGNQVEARSLASDTIRYVAYNFGYGGLTLEYVVLRSPRANLSLGAMLGGGGSEIRLAKARSSDITWDQAAGLEDYHEVSVNASGLAGMPLARLKVRLFNWLSLQAHAGYLYCRANDWKYQVDKDLFNTPRLDASGWVFAAGPHFGF